MRVANVENPNGEISSVMGNSFIVDKITSPAAAPNPGAMSGRLIRIKRERRVTPSVCPASSRFRGMAATDSKTTPIAKDPNRTT